MADGKLYLGDIEIVTAILHRQIEATCYRVSDTDDPRLQERIIEAAGRAVAYIFLGENPITRPVDGWNEPGGIDEFLAERLSLEETKPVERICHAFARMLLEILDISHQVETGELPNGKWQPAAAAVIGRYAELFLGKIPQIQ